MYISHVYICIYTYVFAFIYIHIYIYIIFMFRHVKLTCRRMLGSSPFFYITKIFKMLPSPRRDVHAPNGELGSHRYQPVGT